MDYLLSRAPVPTSLKTFYNTFTPEGTVVMKHSPCTEMSMLQSGLQRVNFQLTSIKPSLKDSSDARRQYAVKLLFFI